MSKANIDIRTALKLAKIPVWTCAAKIGVCENTLLRWLRMEMPADKKERIFKAIDEIKTAQKGGAEV